MMATGRHRHRRRVTQRDRHSIRAPSSPKCGPVSPTLKHSGKYQLRNGGKLVVERDLEAPPVNLCYVSYEGETYAHPLICVAGPIVFMVPVKPNSMVTNSNRYGRFSGVGRSAEYYLIFRGPRCLNRILDQVKERLLKK